VEPPGVTIDQVRLVFLLPHEDVRVDPYLSEWTFFPVSHPRSGVVFREIFIGLR
jgi:hypothetical protein